MRYDDSIEDSRQYLRLALENIGKYGLPTDPVNYCLWYEYASGKNAGLNTAVDSHLEREESFTKEVSLTLFKRYIVGETEIVNTMIRDELKKVFTEIVGAIATTNEDFSESESHLETINDSLVSNLTEADIGRIVGKIKTKNTLIKCI